MIPETMYWNDDEKCLYLLDQKILPAHVGYAVCPNIASVARAIMDMTVRGAPAIGVAAAYGVALGAKEGRSRAIEAVDVLSRTRPTAVNLFWALERMKTILDSEKNDELLFEKALAAAHALKCEDIRANRAIGKNGATLLPDQASVLTHCNAGALATAGYGTALGVFRAAREQGKNLTIYADETRPRLQGARITAWELSTDGFEVTLICEGMAAALMATHNIDAVVTGADRIARNGDTANKIGTYSLAVVARYHGVPLYIAAPASTIDASLSSGSDIPIETRDAAEVRMLPGGGTVPDVIDVWNPAFDVTPSDLVSAIVTENGVFRPPYDF
ncbi:MAG: S-methyl-5-thioribose-1-phosphate isomerase [Synergistota bacterium]|nr:S-methyl-5-thioribose-1-phosphate isomerase [Synergistota bacterium]